jgi:hypothetical protein
VATAFVNGLPGPVGYLGQLRIDQRQPARRRLFRGGYEKLHALHQDGAAPYYVTTIVEDNRPARRLLEAGLQGLPRYEPVEEIVTLVVPLTRRLRGGGPLAVVGRAAPGDAGAIVDCLQRNGRRHQFARLWTADDLACPERTRGLDVTDFFIHRSAGRVEGCLAVWDQGDFKQTVVRGYAPWLARTRPLVNVFGPLLRQPRLPPPGARLASAFVSHLAVDADAGDVALPLIRAAYTQARERGLDYILLGLARRHPLLPSVRRRFAHREYVSVLYRVYWPEDVARLPKLDDRIPHLEVATL